MKRKMIFLVPFFVICMFCISFCENAYASANEPRSYSLVVSGAGIGNGDKDEMEKILQKNKLYSHNSIWTFTYDTEADGIAAGTTKAEYNKAIDTAYKGCTANDTAYFFHSGHGMEGITKGWGIMLKSAYGGLPFSWYKYDDLLNKLGSVSCKHMIVIIHACESGAVKEAYNKLPQNKKNKISLFWSSGANQLSYKNSGLNVSVYGQTLIQLLGYDGTLYADTDNDGNVTVKELGNHINSYIDEVSKYVGAPTQTPGYASAKNLGTVIYSYKSNSKNNTSKESAIKLNKDKATIYTSGNRTVQLKATVKGTSKKVTWKSNNKKIATVNSNGKVTAHKTGSVKITAKANGKTATCKITVKKPSIKLNKSKATIYTSGNKTVQLKATVKGSSKKVTWKSSNKKVATVNSKGIVTAKKAGTVTVTAKANGKTAKCVITVKRKNKICQISAKVINTFPNVSPYTCKLVVSDGAGKNWTKIYDGGKYSSYYGNVSLIDLNGDKQKEIVLNLEIIGSTYGATEIYVYTITNNTLTEILNITSDTVSGYVKNSYACLGAKCYSDYIKVTAKTATTDVKDVIMRWDGKKWIY